MRVDQAEKIVDQAIKNQRVVEVDYVREEDGQTSTRLMEPFQISPGPRSRTGEVKFWGWCLHHNRIEQKTIGNIVRMQITERQFDPAIRRTAKASLGGPRTSRSSSSRSPSRQTGRSVIPRAGAGRRSRFKRSL